MANAAAEPIDILMVDDEVRVADALAFAVEGSGANIRMATNAEQMWAALEERIPAAILLDMHVGLELGVEICRALRSSPNTSQLPIVALSGFADAGTKELAFAAGVDDFITKPFTPSDLLLRVRAQIRRRL